MLLWMAALRILYIARRQGVQKEIYSYDVSSGVWSQLYLTVFIKVASSIAVVNGWLTTVGGTHSNELFSLTGEGNGREWTKNFSPMPTKKRWMTTLCTELC